MTATRLRQRLAACRAEGRGALVVYLTFGDPDPAASIEIVVAAAAAGADVIELGVPFSDPSADGPVIQAAMERALAAGGGLTSALDAVAAIRARGCEVPIVLFGYYNPIFVMGPAAFARRAATVGVDACLTVDLPIDELDELRGPLRDAGLDVIPLLAPTSTEARLARVGALGAPFVYYISMTGVTGAALDAAALSAERFAAVRAAVGAPLMIGFGIKTAADARAAAAHADGVVVGSAVVARIAAAPATAPGAVAELVGELAAALRPGG
ncbi:MAG: tryptophan synthase subunit alpha [Kofleriaceae bacterium]